MEYIRRAGWTQNKLKIVAAVSMLLDHIGAELFPHMLMLRILGRLAFPIFSYFVYEGFLYTHSKRKYLLRIFGMGIMCVIAYYLYAGEFYGNILITYSLSLIVLCGIHMGSAAAFMLTGPSTKITNLGALKIVLGVKNFVFYLVFVSVFASLTGLLTNMLFF